LLERGQSRLGSRGGLKALGWQVLQRCVDGLRCALARWRDRALRPFL